jgi:hypothetical protein
MKFVRKIIILVLLLPVLIFIVYTFWITRIRVKAEMNDIPFPAISNARYARYPELLKESLVVNLVKKDKECEIRLTNNSKLPIPAEESTRAIVCTTEIFKNNGERMGSYNEYFKPLPKSIRDTDASYQIPPHETIILGYVLQIPHGQVKVTVSYQDLSKQYQMGDSVLLLVVKKMDF